MGGGVDAGVDRCAYLDKTSCVVTVEVAKNEAALLGNSKVGDAALDKLVAGHFLVLLEALFILLGVWDGEQGAGLEGVVELHEGVTTAKGPPEQGDGISIVVGLVLLLGHPAVEAGDAAQAHLQRQASLEQRSVLVGALVENVFRGFDGTAVDGRRRGRGGEGRGGPKEGRGGGGLGALGVARTAVRVGRVGALEALVRHEGRRPGRGHPGVCCLRGWRRRRWWWRMGDGIGGMGSHQTRVKR